MNTLFENHTLSACVTQKKLTFPKFPGHKQAYLVDTKILINQHAVIVLDIVSLNGAIHVLDRLLDPREAHHRGHYLYHHHCGLDENEAIKNPHPKYRQEHNHGHWEGLAEGQHGCNIPCSKHDHGTLCRKSDDQCEPGSKFDADTCFTQGDRVVCEKDARDDIWVNWETWLPQWADEML